MIDLGGNQITSLDNSLFAGLTNLEGIYLYENALKSIDTERHFSSQQS